VQPGDTVVLEEADTAGVESSEGSVTDSTQESSSQK